MSQGADLSIQYRAGTREDIDTVKQFFRSEGELSSVAIGVLAHDDLMFWLAHDSDELADAILTRPLPADEGPSYGGVDELLVAEAYRRLGIGRRLMEMAEAYYQERGLAGMQLVVVEDNDPARGLYDSLGYEVVQRRLRMAKRF